jgi:hypothetical protein
VTALRPGTHPSQPDKTIPPLAVPYASRTFRNAAGVTHVRSSGSVRNNRPSTRRQIICDAIARRANGSRCQSHPRRQERMLRGRWRPDRPKPFAVPGVIETQRTQIAQRERCLCFDSRLPLTSPETHKRRNGNLSRSTALFGTGRRWLSKTLIRPAPHAHNKCTAPPGCSPSSSSRARGGVMAGSNATGKVKPDEVRHSHKKLREVRAIVDN